MIRIQPNLTLLISTTTSSVRNLGERQVPWPGNKIRQAYLRSRLLFPPLIPVDLQAQLEPLLISISDYYSGLPFAIPRMGVPFDSAPDRPEHIDVILNGLDRYNPETTTIFQDYVQAQCDDRTYDCYANLALLKLYQFNPTLARDETITNILVKALTVFPSADFALALHLLPPHILQPVSTSTALPAAGDAPLSEAVQKLNVLNNLLGSASYSKFWSTLNSDDLYADLTADVAGFEELIRVRIALTISQSVREIERRVLETWLGMQGDSVDKFVKEICGWQIEGGTIIVPLNKENEAKGTIVRENIKMEQFGRVIRRAYEQPA